MKGRHIGSEVHDHPEELLRQEGQEVALLVEAQAQSLPDTNNEVPEANRADKTDFTVEAVVEIGDARVSQRSEPRDDILDHPVHPVRRKAEAERDDLGKVVRAFEEEAEEAPHPRADEEGVVSSEEIELEEEVVRREDGGDGGDPIHLEALLMEEELEARHLVH